MKYIFIIILSLNFVKGQETRLSDNFSIPHGLFAKKDYESSILNIWYKFQFNSSPSSNAGFRESICLLQIGKNYSKFSDIAFLKKDSILENFNKKNTISSQEFAQALKYKELWPVITLKHISENKIYYQNRIKKLYEYEEEVPVIKWKLENVSKRILGYNCKKATANYRGRNYIAWYTPEISQNNGPYIFQGLPGLIMEIEDSEKKYSFVIAGLDKKPMTIYLQDDKSGLKVGREKFREIQKAYYENPGAFHGKAYNEDGTSMIIRSNKIPYNPMELE